MNKRFLRTTRKLAIVVFMLAVSGAQAADDRMESLGQALICMCGCGQLLTNCNMISCPTSPAMREELGAHIAAGENDQTILAAFASKYGPKVLSAPRTDNWFDLSAWVMPFVVLFAGGVFVIFFLKRLKSRVVPGGEAPPIDVSRYEGEIEDELQRFTPED